MPSAGDLQGPGWIRIPDRLDLPRLLGERLPEVMARSVERCGEPTVVLDSAADAFLEGHAAGAWTSGLVERVFDLVNALSEGADHRVRVAVAVSFLESLAHSDAGRLLAEAHLRGAARSDDLEIVADLA